MGGGLIAQREKRAGINLFATFSAHHRSMASGEQTA
jgi:hypothetical protein